MYPLNCCRDFYFTKLTEPDCVCSLNDTNLLDRVFHINSMSGSLAPLWCWDLHRRCLDSVPLAVSLIKNIIDGKVSSCYTMDIRPAASSISVQKDTLDKDRGATKSLHCEPTFHERVRLDLQSGQDDTHLLAICQQLSGESRWTRGLSATNAQGVVWVRCPKSEASLFDSFLLVSSFLFVNNGPYRDRDARCDSFGLDPDSKRYKDERMLIYAYVDSRAPARTVASVITTYA